jgi:hypothetical protein
MIVISTPSTLHKQPATFQPTTKAGGAARFFHPRQKTTAFDAANRIDTMGSRGGTLKQFSTDGACHRNGAHPPHRFVITEARTVFSDFASEVNYCERLATHSACNWDTVMDIMELPQAGAGTESETVPAVARYPRFLATVFAHHHLGGDTNASH